MNLFKKAQSLSLNTIVIAMLVIIVLLVIIVFFTGSISKTGNTIDENDITLCSINNPAIKSLGYLHAEYSTSSDGKSCEDSRFEIISIIPKAKTEGKICDKTFVEGAVCCGTKIPNSWSCEN